MPEVTGTRSRSSLRLRNARLRQLTDCSPPQVGRGAARGRAGRGWLGVGPALGKVWEFIRSQPGLWTDGHNIFLYHHSTQPGGPILCDFRVEVTRKFETE